jgi:nitronate monooxygenase
VTPRSLLDLFTSPIVVAPMAGGPSTPDLVAAVTSAGALGFLAAGYKSAAAMQSEIEATGASTSGRFGVNLFVPGRPAKDPQVVSDYVSSLSPEAQALGIGLGEPSWDDDDWEAKLSSLLAHPVALATFTFGCPERAVIDALQSAGTVVGVTVTHPDEARAAATGGADFLCIQGTEAGAHRGTFSDGRPPPRDDSAMGLLADTAAITDLPKIVAGGIMDADGVRAALQGGAIAVQCGTAFLRCPESGAHPLHKAALDDSRFTSTAVTRAFSGRSARGLVNQFMLDHADAPVAYPEINNATRPLRAAAAAAGDVDRMSLWAGTGFRAASALAAGEVVERLCDQSVRELFARS